jgi:hypothetical protein
VLSRIANGEVESIDMAAALVSVPVHFLHFHFSVLLFVVRVYKIEGPWVALFVSSFAFRILFVE